MNKKNTIEIDKKDLLVQRENHLLALMTIIPEYAIQFIFSKINIEIISYTNRTVFESLKQRGNIDKAGVLFEIETMGYLGQLDEIKSLVSEYEFYSQYKLERIIEFRLKEFYDISLGIKSEELLSEALEQSQNSLNGLDSLIFTKENIENELRNLPSFKSPLSFNDSIDTILERLDKRYGSSDMYKTKNFASFNSATGGVAESNLIGIAGAYKNGKTTLGLNFILDFAEQNIPIAIFSLEMTRHEIEEKILSYKTGIDYEKIREPRKLSRDEAITISRFKSKVNENEKIFIQDSDVKLSEIENSIKKLAADEGIKFVLLDYLNLIKGFGNYKGSDNREREISYYSNSLKILAKETKTIIIVLTQLNRTGSKDASSINLAESIALARDCDFLFTIYKPKNLGVNSVTLNSNTFPVNNRSFLAKLDISRHSESGREFLLEMANSGKMKEIATKFDNSYLEENLAGIINNEDEEIFPI